MQAGHTEFQETNNVMVIVNQRGARHEQGCGCNEVSEFDVDEALAAKSGQKKRRNLLGVLYCARWKQRQD